jgi:hypothetical protein
MGKTNADIEADISAVTDRGENVSEMEPLLNSETAKQRGELTDLAVNLIEGHDTHPIDIERALKKDYSKDPYKRDLQHEAQAHVAKLVTPGRRRRAQMVRKALRAGR